MRVQEGPDELAADVFKAKFKMGVLEHGVVRTIESSCADVEALLVGNFVRRDQMMGIACARCGDCGVVGMSEVIAQGDARWSSFDQLAGSAVEHWRLGGHGVSVMDIL